MINYNKFVVMKKVELEALIAQGEGLHLEFKRSINKDIAKEFVAFANTKGGKVLIGVDDDGNIMTNALGNDELSKVQGIASNCDPSLDIDIEKVDGVPEVLVVNVPQGHNKPYMCSSGFYVRESANSQKKKTGDIGEMFLSSDRYSFDDQLCLKADFDTFLSNKALNRFLKRADIEQILPDAETIHNLGALEFVDDKPVFNNTGVLFFTDEPTKFLNQSLIQCVRYKGIEKIDIEDQMDLDGDIISNIDNAFTFLRRSLSVKFVIESGSPTRKEIWEIPYVALREALINAIAHRDYVNKGTHIQVEVFDDRVSITNFGGLPSGLDEKDFGKRSVLRNPNIVSLLQRANFVEKLGTGVKRIEKELTDAGLPKAIYDISQNWVSVIFTRKEGVTKSELPELDFTLNVRDALILEACQVPKSRKEILEGLLEIANRRENYEKNMEHLVLSGLISMTNPDSPTDPNQKYYTTEIGQQFYDDIRSKMN